MYLHRVRWFAYILVLAGICLMACEEPKPVFMQRVEVDYLYAIHLPDFLKPGYDMHDFAELQYYDASSGFYVLGIEDAKSNFGALRRKRLVLKDYYQFVENTVFETADTFHYLGESSFQTPEFKSKVGDYYSINNFLGESYELFYRVCVYEGEEHFIQLVIWLPYESYCSQMEWIDKITYSVNQDSISPKPLLVDSVKPDSSSFDSIQISQEADTLSADPN